MARGDLTIFEEFVGQIGGEHHNFASDVLKLGIINNTAAPTAADATPTWSDYSANEVATTGGYTANGETVGSVTWAEVAGTATLDGANVSLTQNASGFTDGHWGILYNDTSTTDMAIAFVNFRDGTTPINETTGPIAINWNASGILTIAKV